MMKEAMVLVLGIYMYSTLEELKKCILKRIKTMLPGNNSSSSKNCFPLINLTNHSISFSMNPIDTPMHYSPPYEMRANKPLDPSHPTCTYGTSSFHRLYKLHFSIFLACSIILNFCRTKRNFITFYNKNLPHNSSQLLIFSCSFCVSLSFLVFGRIPHKQTLVSLSEHFPESTPEIVLTNQHHKVYQLL